MLDIYICLSYFLKMVKNKIALFMTFFPILPSASGLEEFTNKINFEKSFENCSNLEEWVIELKMETKYDFEDDRWETTEYAISNEFIWTPFRGIGLEYKYIEEYYDRDNQELEFNYFLSPKINNFGIKIENKLIKEFCIERDLLYENESKINRKLFKVCNYPLWLQLENKIKYNFNKGRWEKNEFKPGILIKIKWFNIELKYVYSKKLYSSSDSEGVELESSVKF